MTTHRCWGEALPLSFGKNATRMRKWDLGKSPRPAFLSFSDGPAGSDGPVPSDPAESPC